MLKNYVKIAWRGLLKKKVFSLINITGLAIGIAFTLLIGSYVWQEVQVNSQLKNIDNQYIILSKWKDPNMGSELNSIAELSRELKYEYPALVANYYNSEPSYTIVSKGNRHFNEALQVGDSTLLNIYGFKLRYGNANNALNEPYTVVITSQIAMKYFNRYNVVGETLIFDDLNGHKHDFTVTGVLDKIADNSITRDVLSNIEPGFYFSLNSMNFSFRYIYGWGNKSAESSILLNTSSIAILSGIPPKICCNSPFVITIKIGLLVQLFI